jgi:DNA end-binding protein Ku
MARAIWSGAISFGLVNIPVKLYSAAKKKTVRFHQLDSADNSRIQQKRVNPNTGEEVPYEQLVKGYELSPDRYVVVRPEELEAVEAKKTRTIDIEDFVELDQIDPIYYDHPYYLAPAEGAAKAYALLLQALKDAGKVGIARVVIRSKEQLVAIRPGDSVLVMETLLFGDEVVAPADLGELPAVDELEVGEREVDMARQLIESLSKDFDPDSYRDEYRQAVLDLIERKAEGHEVAIQAAPEAPEEVPDLMAALEASIASAKRQGGAAKEPAKRKPRDKAPPAAGNGSKPGSSGGKASSGKKSASGKASASGKKKRATAKK